MVSARSLVDHEDGLRRQVVVANPKTTDQSGYARAARRAVAAKVKLPPDVYLRYGGTAPARPPRRMSCCCIRRPPWC